MKKDLISLFALSLILCLVVSGTNFQTVEEYNLIHIDDITPESPTVFITLRCDTLLDNDNYAKLEQSLRDEKYVPADGVILPLTEYVLRSGDTVYDILLRTVRHNKIQMECIYTPHFGSIYIQGINHLYEYSCGELSGWMYRVNGKFASLGCSLYTLEDGDVIEWLYTCNLGKDVGNTWEVD